MPKNAIHYGQLAIPVLLLALLGMMILPLPPMLLDVLFSFNIALSLIVLLVCVYLTFAIRFVHVNICRGPPLRRV